MDKQKYLKNYFNDLKDIISFDEKKIDNLIKVSEILKETHLKGKKTLIFGNAHQILLLSLVDLIIGKSEYPPN